MQQTGIDEYACLKKMIFCPRHQPRSDSWKLTSVGCIILHAKQSFSCLKTATLQVLRTYATAATSTTHSLKNVALKPAYIAPIESSSAKCPSKVVLRAMACVVLALQPFHDDYDNSCANAVVNCV